jgi:hypothetical protein
MVYVSIQHIIGTAALLVLVLSLAYAYQIVVTSVQVSVIRTQMEQVAEYVAQSVSDVVSLTEFAYGALSSGTVSKSLKLPPDLSGRPYLIRLEGGGGSYYVVVEVSGMSNVYARSPIPLRNTTAAVKIVTGEDPDVSSALLGVEPKPCVYGGNEKAVVWCKKTWIEGQGYVILVGLGVREG